MGQQKTDYDCQKQKYCKSKDWCWKSLSGGIYSEKTEKEQVCTNCHVDADNIYHG